MVGQCIKRLESELGAPLFVRENKGVRLTSAGELFVDEGREILHKSQRLVRDISSISNTEEQKLRIGISPFYSFHYLPRIVTAFSGLFPAVKLDIAEMYSYQLEQMILDDEADLCLIPLPIDHKEIEWQPIYQEQILFAMPSHHELNKFVTPAMSNGFPFINLTSARNEPFIFLRKEQKFTSMALQLCEDAGFTPHIVFETMNWDTINSLIASGVGVGFVPEILTSSAAMNKKPIYCRIMEGNTTRSYVVAYRKDRALSTVAQHFIRIAKHSLS